MGDVVTRSLNGKKKHYIRYVDTDGKRKMRLSGQTTRESAKVYLAEVEARVRRGIIGIPEADEIKKQGITVAELCETWLEKSTPESKNLRRYKRVYGCVIRTRIVPQIGKMRAVELTPDRVREMRISLSKEGYADNSQNEAIRVLSTVYTWGISKRLLNCQHPVKDGHDLWLVPVASVEHHGAEDVTKILSYVAQNAPEMPLDAAVGAYMAVCALFTGCRKGELFGLRWTDIDFQRQRIHVQHSYAGTPKSGKPRMIPLDPGLIPYLEAWRQRCPTTEGLVFARPVYATQHPKPIIRWAMGEDRHLQKIRELLTAAGVTATHEDPWHAMRHTFATMYLEQGGRIERLSRILGHASIRVTERTYLHPSEDYLTASMPLSFPASPAA